MAWTRRYQLFLLLTVASLRYVRSEICNLDRVAPMGVLDAKLFEGKWYLKMMTSGFPDNERLTGYEITVLSGQSEGENSYLNITRRKTYSHDMKVTVQNEWQCTQYVDDCSVSGFSNWEKRFKIVDTDYSTIFANWWAGTIEGEFREILSIFVRDPCQLPDMAAIQARLVPFCNNNSRAVSPGSDFYVRRLSYVDLPACSPMTE